MTLGERIKKIRQDAGLLQRKFGELVGLDANTISGYETNRDKPGKARLYVIADKFGINPEWLIDGKGEPYKSQEVDEATRKKIEREHIRRIFLQLPEETQLAILDVLRNEIAAQTPTRVTNNNAEVNGDVSGDVTINQS